MKKLTLNVEALQVESFQPAGGQPLRGTVNGAEFMTSPYDCVTGTCGDSVHRPCMD